MSNIDLQALIPNNVHLGENRQLQRALEHWQPAFLSWWDEMGPSDFRAKEVYLRTAVGVDAQGWASYGYTPMPDYRWGIFLADKEEGRKIGFGDFMGQDVWQDVPGEYRSTFRRLIVTQGDTEPASVEQQRLLGHTAPSLYDLRNLFQVNVEEGRHLWAMVYLLHAHFGRDGREEAEELLERHSGDPNKPRILGTFNEPMDNWLSFFMFTYFTDRDGKFQLKSFAESAFDPLARTTRFMLTEEAHHMFVGETGVGRVIKRTLEVMKELDTDDVATLRKAGVIDLPTVQRFMNFWFSSSLDLFGSEASSNAANYFSNGIKGRPDEAKFADHVEVGHRTDHPGAQRAGRLEKRDRAHAQWHERDHASGIREGLQCGRDAVEHGNQARGCELRAEAAFHAFSPAGRCVGRCFHRFPRPADQPSRIRCPQGRMVAQRCGQQLRQEPDAARDRARQDGRLDRAARPRHQCPGGRIPVREALRCCHCRA